MTVLRIYPSSVVAGQGFTTAQLGKVLNNTTDYGTHAGLVAINAGYGGTFKFPFSQLPANIGSITSVEAGIIAKASLANSRQFYSFECYHASSSTTLAFKNQPSSTPGRLTTADTTILINTGFTGGLFNTSDLTKWRDDNVEVNATFIGIANPTSNITTYWDRFWLDITYELAPSANGAGVMFLGENN